MGIVEQNRDFFNAQNKEYYLGSGKRTAVNDKIKEFASIIPEGSTEETVKTILKTILIKIPMASNSKDAKKFKRSAEEIMKDGSRNGCCDSSTVFVTLCRAKGIPAVQFITANLYEMNNGNFGSGHFFSGYYSKEEEKWKVIDSDIRPYKNIKPDILVDNLFQKDYNPDSDFIESDYYLFACEKDYSDFNIDGISIDSINSMNEIHRYIHAEYILNNSIPNYKLRSYLYNVLMTKKVLSIEYIEKFKEDFFAIIPELEAEEECNKNSNLTENNMWKQTEIDLSKSKCNYEERLAILLSNVSKPFYNTNDDNIAYKKSAIMSRTILNKLGYSSQSIQNIMSLISSYDKWFDNIDMER